MKMFVSQKDGLGSIALHIIGLLIACFVFLVIAVAFYRLTFHPLAKYPGPFLAKLTDIHLAYHAWKGDRHLHFYRCHEQYGEKFLCPLSRENHSVSYHPEGIKEL